MTNRKEDHGDSNGGLPANILQFLSKIPSAWVLDTSDKIVFVNAFIYRENEQSHTPSSDSGSLKRDRSYNERYDDRYDGRYDDRYNDRNRGRSTRQPYNNIQNQSHAQDGNKRLRIDPRTKRPIENSRESHSTDSHLNTHSHSHTNSELNHSPHNSYQQDRKSPTPTSQENSHNFSHSHSNNKSVDALGNFDWVAFDPSQPQCWILAGKAFEKTFGFVPSNEQIGSCAFMWVYYSNMQTMQAAQQQQQMMDQSPTNDNRGRSTSRSRSRSRSISRSRSRTPLHD